MLASISQALSNLYHFGTFNVNHLTKSGNTRLLEAIWARDVPKVQQLLAAGANVEQRVDGRCPIHFAAAKGYADIVSALIEGGAKLDVRASTVHDDTPLHSACRVGRGEAAIVLMNAHASLTAVNDGGVTPIALAILEKQTEMVNAFLGIPKTSSLTRETLINLAEKATKEGNKDLLSYLFLEYPDVLRHVQEKEARGAEAVKHEAVQVQAQAPVEDAMDLDEPPAPKHFPPLTYAIVSGNTAEALRLIDAGADVNDYGGSFAICNPLHLAAQGGHREIVLALLKKKANVEAEDRSIGSQRPIHYAAAEGHTTIVMDLVQHGADPIAEDGIGTIPIEAAVLHGRFETVKALLGNPKVAEHEATGKVLASNNRCLMYCAQTGDFGFLDMLLRYSKVSFNLSCSPKDVLDVAKSYGRETIFLSKALEAVRQVTKRRAAPEVLEEGQEPPAKRRRLGGSQS